MPQQTFLLVLVLVIISAGTTVALAVMLGTNLAIVSGAALALSLVVRRVTR